MKQLLTFSLFIILASCGKNMKSTIKGMNDSFKAPARSNILQSIGINNDASESASGISLVYFSSYTCGSCKKEQRHMADHIKNATELNIDIYTVLISIDNTNKLAKNNFRSTVGLKWPLLTDPKMKAFKALCRGDQTPCTIAINKQNEILFSHTGVMSIKDIESKMKTKIIKKDGTGTATVPNVPSDPGSQSGGDRVDFIENLELSTLNPDVKIVTKSFDTQNITRPLIVLFSSFMCLSCMAENKELAALVESGDTRFQNVDIITSYFLPMTEDVHSDTAKNLIEKFRDETKVKWPVVLDQMNRTTMEIKLFTKYVQDTNGFKVPPGTAVFLPGKGRVFHKEGAHIIDLVKALKL